jgi:catechol 2,3-dioxygenase-like lactoylglutathione lyase family enzyme
MNPHRGLLHHLTIVVSDLSTSSPFYGAVLRYLGYEPGDRSATFEDWKRWDLGTPHEISIVQVADRHRGVDHVRGAVGHHHHLAFCADDRADVDRFYADVLRPLAAQGHCVVEDPPTECPEYDEGYYATYFFDPDGLKFEFVVNEARDRRRAARAAATPPPRAAP